MSMSSNVKYKTKMTVFLLVVMMMATMVMIFMMMRAIVHKDDGGKLTGIIIVRIKRTIMQFKI